MALDPVIVSRMVNTGSRPLDRLTERERVVLDLMAQGHSNRSIAELLVVSERAVEKHAASIFTKFDLPPAAADNRRVKAVVAYLQESRP